MSTGSYKCSSWIQPMNSPLEVLRWSSQQCGAGSGRFWSGCHTALRTARSGVAARSTHPGKMGGGSGGPRQSSNAEARSHPNPGVPL